MKATIHNLHEVSEQDVFDTIAEHLLRQGKRSLGRVRSTCQYHNADGLKCAAGCLVPDDVYDFTWEGMTWNELVATGEVVDRYADIIQQLQYVHDSEEGEQYWPNKLRIIAEGYKLDTQKLEKWIAELK